MIAHRTNDETASEAEQPRRARGVERNMGFVVLWCANDAKALGAWAQVSRTPKILGRGHGRADDPGPRLTFVHQRPGANRQAPVISNPTVSRQQLEATALDGQITIRNLGRLALTVNGEDATEARLREGDVIEIGSQLSLLCTMRPPYLPNEEVTQAHDFGAPDAHGLIGESPEMWRLRSTLEFVGSRAGHVLIHGPSGAGKELTARALHTISKRGGAFVARNAATIPETLIDAELFGNAKNYPNPGLPERKGLIGAADAGTLFLDEFAELPPSQQAHLLRVLDDGEYQRLGEAQMRRSRLCLVAATNQPYAALRADVLNRFAFKLELPPLSALRDDIPLLVRHLLHAIVAEDPALRLKYWADHDAPRVALELIRKLVRSPPAGNVRELRNVLWSCVAASDGDTIRWQPDAIATDQNGDDMQDAADELGRDPEATRQLRLRIEAALDRHQRSPAKAYEAAGFSSRYALMRAMRKLGIETRRRG
jgi:DNA-binding NtrC family response regulator